LNWLVGKITDITDEQYKAVYSALSPSRKAHIDKMKKEDARKRSLMATYLLNELLFKKGMRKFKIETDENGKPFLKDSNLFISISHSYDLVACAVSEKPIGIDIEKIRSVSRKLIEYVCTDKEREFVLSSKNALGKDTVEGKAAKRFFAVWTAKEAFFKTGNSGEKNIRSIDTLSLKKQEFIIDGYYITIILEHNA